VKFDPEGTARQPALRADVHWPGMLEGDESWLRQNKGFKYAGKPRPGYGKDGGMLEKYI